MDGYEPYAEPLPVAEQVVEYVFPVEVEVRSIGSEVDHDAIVDRALVALAEELAAR